MTYRDERYIQRVWNSVGQNISNFGRLEVAFERCSYISKNSADLSVFDVFQQNKVLEVGVELAILTKSRGCSRTSYTAHPARRSIPASHRDPGDRHETMAGPVRCSSNNKTLQ